MIGLLQAGFIFLALACGLELCAADKSYLAALQSTPMHPSAGRGMKRTLSYSQSNINQPLESKRRRGPEGCRTDYEFDYLMLTLQWGPGFCATSPRACTRSENRFFTIHGMWATSYDRELPGFCCFDNTFSYAEIKTLVPALDEYWKSYYDENNVGFWSHEWLKHGTCMKDINKLQGELNFFGTTLDIAKKLPVLNTLKRDGIIPIARKAYESLAIRRSLEKLTGGKHVSVDCDYEHNQPTPILKGVNFCLDRNLKFIDCPFTKGRCTRQLIFLNTNK